jgi:hypothetical protein
MLQRIENFMERILPDLIKESKIREKRTDAVVQKSQEARTDSEDKLFAAYREVGIVTSRTGHRRRWD